MNKFKVGDIVIPEEFETIRVDFNSDGNKSILFTRPMHDLVGKPCIVTNEPTEATIDRVIIQEGTSFESQKSKFYWLTDYLTPQAKLGDRFNSGKMQWSLVDFKALEPMVQVLMYGAQKYSPDNWKKGLPINEVIDSLMRHLVAFKDGEDNDSESGLLHTGHILCNAMFLSYMLTNRPDLDNRTKSV